MDAYLGADERTRDELQVAAEAIARGGREFVETTFATLYAGLPDDDLAAHAVVLDLSLGPGGIEDYRFRRRDGVDGDLLAAGETAPGILAVNSLRVVAPPGTSVAPTDLAQSLYDALVAAITEPRPATLFSDPDASVDLSTVPAQPVDVVEEA